MTPPFLFAPLLLFHSFLSCPALSSPSLVSISDTVSSLLSQRIKECEINFRIPAFNYGRDDADPEKPDVLVHPQCLIFRAFGDAFLLTRLPVSSDQSGFGPLSSRKHFRSQNRMVFASFFLFHKISPFPSSRTKHLHSCKHTSSFLSCF